MLVKSARLVSLLRPLPRSRLTRFLRVILSGLLCAFPHAVFAAQSEANVVTVGVYMTDVYDINLNQNEYTAQFYLWFRSNDAPFDPRGRIEVVNSKEFQLTNYYQSEAEDEFYVAMSARARINEQWDVSRYPFDTQTLNIQIEDIVDADV